MKWYPERQFVIFRVLLGLYVVYHFLVLFPFRAELFSVNGMSARCATDALRYVNATGFDWYSPSSLAILFTLGIFLGIILVSGFLRIPCALILAYGTLALWHRNMYLRDLDDFYVPFLLSAAAFVPLGERWKRAAGEERVWQMSATLYWGGWLILALGYGASGYAKWNGPYWQDGSAVPNLMSSPIARPSLFLSAFNHLPVAVERMMTYLSLYGELLCPLLLLNRWTRCAGWIVLTGMQIGIGTFTYLTDLSYTVLLFHLLLFDVRWFGPFRALADRFRT